MSVSEKIFVGLPLHEKESQETLDVALGNIDDRLNELNVDASINIQINGLETAKGYKPGLAINQSKFNAEIELVNSEHLGQIRAIDDLLRKAAARSIHYAFITDADIYRFPGSMKNMWEQADKSVIGAHYRPYPLEVVEEELGARSYKERLLYEIFDGDQHPVVRKILRQNGIERNEWVKGSLMLLDVDAAQGMHGGQGHAADSVMNRIMGPDQSRIADGAYFMHMGRTDMTDHIKARLRHFRGAAARNELDDFLNKEVSLPDDGTIDRIAQEIRRTASRGDYHARLYLARCAVRERVNQICLAVASHERAVSETGTVNPISMEEILTYSDAKEAVSCFFVDIDWDDVCGFALGPPPITQERTRRPFDMDHHMSNQHLARVILDSLGIESLDQKRR